MMRKFTYIFILLCPFLLLAAPCHDHHAGHVHGPGCEHDHHDHADHADHKDHAEHAAPAPGPVTRIVLSASALRNCGLDAAALQEVRPGTYSRTVDFPGMVVEWPGHSSHVVAAPVRGTVVRMLAEVGQVLEPGATLFEIRLVEPESVAVQTEFLTLLQERANAGADSQRLAPIADAVPEEARANRFRVLELDARLDALRDVLRLQGFEETEIREVLEGRRQLLRTLNVRVPETAEGGTFHLATLDVAPGDVVEPGQKLATVADFAQLQVEGWAFASDASMLERAFEAQRPISATFRQDGGEPLRVRDLKWRTLDNRVDTERRTLSVYAGLQNTPLLETAPGSFLVWRFRPGQRCVLHVELDVLGNCFVLPTDAVARELQEFAVFEKVGEEAGLPVWERRNVHVLYQSGSEVVVANDGTLAVGAKVAPRGASFLLAALNAKLLQPAGGAGRVQHGDHFH